MSIIIDEMKSTISTLLNAEATNSSGFVSFKKRVVLDYTTKVKDELLTMLSSEEDSDEVIFEKLKFFLHHHWKNTCGTALFYTAIPNESVSQCLYYIAEQLHQFYETSSSTREKPITAFEYLVPPGALKMDSEHSSFVSLCAVEGSIFSESEQAEYNELTRKLFYFNRNDYQLVEQADLHNQSQQVHKNSTETNKRKGKELERFNLLTERFNFLEVKKLTCDLEQQQIKDGLLIEQNGWLIPNRALMNVMGSSILSDSQKTLIPVSVLCQDTLFNPMGEGALLKSEIERLKNHSGISVALTMAQQELDHLQSDQSHLLGHLKMLVQELKMFGVEGIGTERDASKLVSFSLIKFYTLFDQLNDAQKTHIPNELMVEINKLRDLSSQREKEAHAVDIIDTCINLRQQEITKAMHGHELLLASITPNQDTLSDLIHQAQRKVDDLKKDFVNSFNNGQYSGKDSLPITKTLIDLLELQIALETQEDLLALLELPLEILSPFFDENRGNLLELIPSIDTFVEIIIDTNITQLKTLMSATKPWLVQALFRNMDSVMSVLTILDNEKCAVLYSELRAQKYDFWDYYRVFPLLEHRPGILSILSTDERLLWAVYSGQIEIIKNIFNNFKPESSTVCKAIQTGFLCDKLDIVKHILSLTGDNKPDSAAVFKALHLSIVANKLDIAKCILSLTGDNKLDSAAVGKALHLSISDNKLDIVKHILSLTGDNKPDSAAVCEALNLSIAANKLDIAKCILSLTGDNKLDSAAVGKALHLSISDNKLDIAKYILSLTGDNKPDNAAVCTALDFSIITGKLDIVKYIISLTGNNKPYSIDISNASYSAAWNDKLEILKYILSLAGDNKLNIDQVMMAFMVAYSHEQKSVTQYFILQPNTGLDLECVSTRFGLDLKCVSTPLGSQTKQFAYFVQNLIKWRNNFLSIVEELKVKEETLRQKGFIDAANSALLLGNILQENYNKFANQDITPEVFSETCRDAIAQARPELEKQRDCKKTLLYIGLAVTGLLAIYALFYVVKKLTVGAYGFFQTDSAEKLNRLDEITSKIPEQKSR